MDDGDRNDVDKWFESGTGQNFSAILMVVAAVGIVVYIIAALLS